MNQKTFIGVTGMVFGIIALLHGLRLVFGWSAVVGAWQIPLWISWLALALSGYLAYTALTLRK